MSVLDALPRCTFSWRKIILSKQFAIKVLYEAGHSVVVASNGREAVQKSRCETFDVILMDVQMPVINGLEATRQIRAEEIASGRRTPTTLHWCTPLRVTRTSVLRLEWMEYYEADWGFAS